MFVVSSFDLGVPSSGQNRKARLFMYGWKKIAHGFLRLAVAEAAADATAHVRGQILQERAVVQHPLLVVVVERPVVVVLVHHRREADLLLVREAGGLLRRLLGLGEHREEDGGEDGDDRDHDEELDEGEGALHDGNPIHYGRGT